MELVPRDEIVKRRHQIPADAKERAHQRQWLMFKADWLEALLEDTVHEIEALDQYASEQADSADEADS